MMICLSKKMWRLIIKDKKLNQSFDTKKDAELEVCSRKGLLKYLGVKDVYRIKRI